MPLDEYLQKYKPTMVVDDGTKPWIWVRRLEQEPLDSATPNDDSYDSATVERAQHLLEEYTEKIASIQKDVSIPVRANKKKGLRSKKEVREEVMAEATSKFKELSQEGKLTCGKWLFFVPSEQIDGAFARLARELVTGSLSKTSAFSAKVATTPADTGPNHRYLICLYLPDLYNKDASTECQSGSLIGLDSKHSSGIKSTIWNPTDLVPDAELKALVDSYWSSANQKLTTSDANPTEDSSAKGGSGKKPTKRPRTDESDDGVFDDVEPGLDEDQETPKDNALGTKLGEDSLSISASKKGVQAPSQDDSATASESDEPPPAKAVTMAMRKPVPPKLDEASSSDEEVKKPKKIRKF